MRTRKCELHRRENETHEYRNLKGLLVDEKYQRDYDERWANDIAGRFLREDFGTPVLSRRADGTLWIIDGQHRIGAAKSIGLENDVFVFRIMHSLTREEEAMMYYRLNKRTKRPTAWGNYKSRLTGKDETIMQIENVVRASGLRTGTASSPRTVRAVTTLEVAHKRYANLHLVLPVLREWADEFQSAGDINQSRSKDCGAYETPLIRYVARFFAEFPKADPPVLCSQLIKHAGPPARLLATFKRNHSMGGGAPMYEIAVATLVTLYNFHQRSKLDAAERVLLPTNPIVEQAEDDATDEQEASN